MNKVVSYIIYLFVVDKKGFLVCMTKTVSKIYTFTESSEPSRSVITTHQNP